MRNRRIIVRFVAQSLLLVAAMFAATAPFWAPTPRAAEPAKEQAAEPAADQPNDPAKVSRQSHIGRTIEPFSLSDFRGRKWSLAELDGTKLTVVAFLGTECPLARLYGRRLAEMHGKYAPKGVAFLAINSNQQDSLTELAHYARVHEIEFPVLKDPGNVVADQFRAERTPEIFVLDAEHVVRYHGRIDDQYGYGVQRTAPTRNDLALALDELLEGKEVSVPDTNLVGCHIGRLLRSDEESDVTYSRQISRIFQDHCVECHRSGEIAPFSLTSYSDVVGWAEMIEEVVRQRRMPPWFANADHGHFENDIRLSDEEKDTIYRWVAAGAPEGDRADLPEPRQFVEGWRIGEPDLILPMREKPFPVPATGEVKYQYFLVDPGFKEDVWIQAAECRPGNRAVVHHILVGIAPGRGPVHGLRSTWLAAVAPGAPPLVLPEGMAKRIPAGSKLYFQLHYTPNGTAQEDISSVGFVFADPKTVRQEVATRQAANHGIRIPPGEANYQIEADYTFRQDTLLLSMLPHMHLRGKSFRYEAKYPDGTSEILLDVPRYDFNWQNWYDLEEPKRMPAGTKLHCTATFDNSERNLANPNPNVTVRWGDQTWEEMMIGYFNMALADQDLMKDPKPLGQEAGGDPQEADSLVGLEGPEDAE